MHECIKSRQKWPIRRLLILTLLFALYVSTTHAQGNVISIPKRIQLPTRDVSITTRNNEVHVFTVEIANTPYARVQGLMHRTSMHADHGMLFLFETPAERHFWMKNTLIPLDMLFLKKDGTIHHIHHNAQPESLERISSQGEIFHVLEILGGQAQSREITIGDTVLYEKHPRAR